ncbi:MULTISPECIES: DUF2165 family protein [Acetobacter]|uniref:DUF2165 domain-containing protein n=1 Tax=Acetobacter pomorum DM001 TaxID=945681 RepID=F1YQY0_9PROT|nr:MULTISPECIES: DUF2165 domain-containing protein [Acetobacter]ATI11166.1 DUF2165 domain-containing protein [Acetobacter pomorum]AXC26494.1 DUF2165 domain-containing protein [Acetobacter sp. JWB]EGE49015.1 Hypothetical protein APO_0301 [Acetobacter pomorum DM001]KAA8427947.1 DUF2165 domain-containing protein [Acetobacter pomorum]KAA8436976.1 DUF2165 domain-containing protein [Acetobacter pomorum]
MQECYMLRLSAFSSPVVLSRLAKTAMVGALGTFGLIVALNNVTDYKSNFQFVRHVLSMDTTFRGNSLMWRAISQPVLWHLFYGLIILGEAATGLLFAIAACQMGARLLAPQDTFRVAKKFVPVATALGFLIWFFGFSVVGAEWFLMWQSQAWNGQQPAFRFFITMLAVCIYVQQPE